MPRLWVMSDLHLETVPHPEAFRPVRLAFDVLVVAGDLWEGSSARALAIVAGLADGKPAVFVLGNHEPWHRDLAEERAAACRAADRHGVTLLDDDEAECAGVRFVGGTLWADGELAGKERARGGRRVSRSMSIAAVAPAGSPTETRRRCTGKPGM